MNSQPSSAWLKAQIDEALNAFATQLRSGVDGSTKIPNLDWTVADLGAHVSCLPAVYQRVHHEGRGFKVPGDFAAFSDASRAHITETDPAALADLLETEIGRYVDQVTDPREPRWLYGIETTAGNICAMFLNELIIHGRDLAAVTGASVPDLTREQANAIVDAIVVTAPAFIDQAKARAAPDGVYGVSFRGGNDYTWTLSGDQLDISPGKPAKADARLNADPATFVLSSLGRISDVRAALTGGVVSYGRKPWRFFALGNMTADGV